MHARDQGNLISRRQLSDKRAKNSAEQVQIIIMTPRKGQGTKKQDKHSDSESEMPSSTESTRQRKAGSRSNMAKSYDLTKGNRKVFGRLVAFAGLLLVTFATRFYGIEDPTHIW